MILDAMAVAKQNDGRWTLEVGCWMKSAAEVDEQQKLNQKRKKVEDIKWERRECG